MPFEKVSMRRSCAAVISTVARARAAAAGQDPAGQLSAQRSHAFFAALGDLLVTGPTRTNVNDLRIALVD